MTSIKSTLASLVAIGAMSSVTIAGAVEAPIVMPESRAADAFADARRPISNPTLFDLALPTTNVHPIFLHHRLPDRISTTGADLALGGDVQRSSKSRSTSASRSSRPRTATWT